MSPTRSPVLQTLVSGHRTLSGSNLPELSALVRVQVLPTESAANTRREDKDVICGSLPLLTHLGVYVQSLTGTYFTFVYLHGMSIPENN